MLRISGITMTPGQDDHAASLLALKRLGLLESDVLSWRIVKKSLDARKKADICFHYTLDISYKGDERALLRQIKPKDTVIRQEPAVFMVQRPQRTCPVIIAGAGPCGLAAALYLAKAGLQPTILERGELVDDRLRSISRFFTDGILDPESNVQFGEGGAGAFSDGKLTTGIKDPLCQIILETLHAHGAPDDVLYLSHPHLGTDRLPGIIKSISREIKQEGGTLLPRSRLSGLVMRDGRLVAVRYVADGMEQEITASRLILALGHSARDTQRMLYSAGLLMAQKPFSIGLRIEHKQQMIDTAQYGAFAVKGLLPPATYQLSMKARDGRGVYTFCMCPGGRVIAAASEPGCLCTNGMSTYARNGVNANAALLVDVRPDDYNQGGVLDGFAYQQRYEQEAYVAGGGRYVAPAQRVEDFLVNRPSKHLGDIAPSYLPGVAPGDLSPLLPVHAVSGIREAIRVFNCKLSGFANPDAALIGVETRSSSPVRVLRDNQREANIKGIYPAGEGAGYAGGIMSAAVDGIRSAIAVVQSLD